MAIVSSENSNFAKAVKTGGAVSQATLDEVVQWVEPSKEVLLQEQAVMPGDETFINEQWALTAVEATGAWATGYTGAEVRVAILDGGIWNSHVDIAPNLDVARSISFVPGFNYNQDTGTFWHGTHVAGIVAAADNAIGTVGIAPGATLIGVKVLHNGSGSFGQVISGILYASDPISAGGGGADIINMSLAATFNRVGGNTGAGQLISALAKAVNYATAHNVLVVSSAGNGDANGIGIDLDHSGNLITVPAQSGRRMTRTATATTRSMDRAS